MCIIASIGGIFSICFAFEFECSRALIENRKWGLDICNAYKVLVNLGWLFAFHCFISNSDQCTILGVKSCQRCMKDFYFSSFKSWLNGIHGIFFCQYLHIYFLTHEFTSFFTNGFTILSMLCQEIGHTCNLYSLCYLRWYLILQTCYLIGYLFFSNFILLRWIEVYLACVWNVAGLGHYHLVFCKKHSCIHLSFMRS